MVASRLASAPRSFKTATTASSRPDGSIDPHDLSLDPSTEHSLHLASVGNAVYDARGAVVFCSERVWVVDFGIPAYQDSKPPAWAKVNAS